MDQLYRALGLQVFRLIWECILPKVLQIFHVGVLVIVSIV